MAAAARVEPAYLVVAAGLLLWNYLNRAAKGVTMLAFDSPEADIAAARLLAIAAFVLVQRIAFGLEFRAWLRPRGERPVAGGDECCDDGGDEGDNEGCDDGSVGPIESLLGLPTVVGGVTFALLFALPVAAVNAAGVNVIPVYGTGFPSGLRALVTLFIAPLSEEIFFRAWLLGAFARAGGEASAALIASAGLYGLYVVPISSVLAGTTGGDGPALLLLYEALGAFLAYLFQRSGGSLTLVVTTHCAFNLALALLATQVDPADGAHELGLTYLI